MKKAFFVLILSLCLGLCACSNGPLPVESWAGELPNVFEMNDTEATLDPTDPETTATDIAG